MTPTSATLASAWTTSSTCASASAPHLGIARCYALLGRFKEAREYLRNAPVSRETIRNLADDPDFAEMSAHPKYGDVFET